MSNWGGQIMEFIPVSQPKDGTQIKYDYAVNPTLLDAYLRFKRKDDDETFETLMCKINGIKLELPEEVQETINKGIEFEELVNRLLDRADDKSWFSDAIGNIGIAMAIQNKLQYNSGMQVYQEAFLKTPYGIIKLYGILDYEFPEMIVDLKTVAHYSCNKYAEYSQHSMYSLIRELNNKPIKAFKYLITDFKKIYQETYIPNKQMYIGLMQNVYEFIAFINHFKPAITNNKIFGFTKN